MDPVSSAATASFLQSSGPWGAIVILLTVVAFLYRRTIALQDQITEMGERRVVEVGSLAARTEGGLTNSTTNTAALKLAVDSAITQLQDIKEILQLMPPAIQGISKQVEGNATRIEGLTGAVRGDRR